jgi:hypothetical protein
MSKGPKQMYMCGCKPCKKMRKKGYILGTRKMGFWLTFGNEGTPEYYYGKVSDYVPYHRWQKGRRPDINVQ